MCNIMYIIYIITRAGAGVVNHTMITIIMINIDGTTSEQDEMKRTKIKRLSHIVIYKGQKKGIGGGTLLLHFTPGPTL